MSHLIDTTTGRAAIAYVNEVPWHGLGHPLPAGASPEAWQEKAGLLYTVQRTPALYQRGEDLPIQGVAGRDVLYRSDTGDALSVVSHGYHVVQPAEVLAFFSKLAEAGGFTLETAGALSGGRRVWGLAKVSDGAPVVGHDLVRPYLLLATSYDGTMATTAKFTAVRVVCHNTLTMAAGSATGAQSEEDRTEGAVVQCVRVPHMQKFDADAVRQRLGIVLTAWERWIVEARLLAQVDVSEAQADKVLSGLLAATQRNSDVRQSRSYKRLMGLFDGAQIGAELCGKGNAWALLNAVTDYVDHERGRSADTRMTSAWFGAGDGLKSSAWKAVRDLAVQAGAIAADTTA